MFGRQWRAVKKRTALWAMKQVGPPGSRHVSGWRKWVPIVYGFAAWNSFALVIYFGYYKDDTMTMEERVLSRTKGNPVILNIGGPPAPINELPSDKGSSHT